MAMINRNYKDTVFRMIFGKNKKELLQSMIDRTELYGTKRKKIDAPHFIMFYNGKEPLTVTEYRLSEMYSVPEAEPQLELIVKLVNINAGQDNGILSRCKTLEEYADYVATVRRFSEEYPLNKAVPMAVDDCIRRGILADFLARHKAQVIKVSIYEITEEEYKEVLQRDAREDGVDEGELRKLITLIRKKIAKGKPLPVIAEELEETEENIVPLYKAVLAAGEDASEKEIVEQFLWK